MEPIPRLFDLNAPAQNSPTKVCNSRRMPSPLHPANCLDTAALPEQPAARQSQTAEGQWPTWPRVRRKNRDAKARCRQQDAGGHEQPARLRDTAAATAPTDNATDPRTARNGDGPEENPPMMGCV
jgi:hypothetical protein